MSTASMTGQRQQPTMPISRTSLLLAAVFYALAVAYVSVLPFNYVPISLAEAIERFLQTQYIVNGSDQEADWAANLIMFVPLGFLTAGSLWAGRMGVARYFSICLALTICVLFLLAVKLLQLYFPPRTVTINYILAQIVGSLVGVILWRSLHGIIPRLRTAMEIGGQEATRAVLVLYALFFAFSVLFPFNFTWTSEDLAAKLATLPGQLLSFPGIGRSSIERILIVLAEIIAVMPLGAMLAMLRLPRLNRPYVVIMLGASCGATILLAHIFIIDADSRLSSIATAAAGFWFGYSARRLLRRFNLRSLRRWLSASAPFLALLYLLGIVAVNGLLNAHWRTTSQAFEAIEWFGLYPFWHHYIVGKAQALLSTIVHIAMYAPIGTLLWARSSSNRGRGAIAAAIIAAAIAGVVEVARQYKPGLQMDLTNAIIGAFAAAAAYGLSDKLWRWISAEPTVRETVRESGPPAQHQAAPEAPPPHAKRVRAPVQSRFAMWSVVLSISLVAGVAYDAAKYPLQPAVLMAFLLCYAALLWFKPHAWLLIVPLLIPTADLTPWTGWLYVQESDLFVALTLAVLLLRSPPSSDDFAVGRGSAAALLFVILTYSASIALGFLHLPGIPDASENPYLDAHNAIRLAKGLAIPLTLLPFLGQAFRRRTDAFNLLSWGMIFGLSAVCVAAIFERYVFVDVFDLAVDYRVVSTFSSMHLGGGHVGAYLAMTLPFLMVGLGARKQPLRVAFAVVVAIAAGFTLITTYSRTDAVAAIIAILIATVGYAAAMTSDRRRPALSRAVLVVIGGGTIVAGLVVTAASSDFMRQRMSTVIPDLATREGNWASGLAVRERGVLAALFGSGLGSYPRIYAARNPGGLAPETFAVRQEGGKTFLTLISGRPIYFGQKVAVVPDSSYRFSVTVRFADAKTELAAILCEKWLLYSLRCQSITIHPRTPGQWEVYTASIVSGRMGDSGHGAWPLRPVDLSFTLPPDQSRVDIRDVRLLDPLGTNLVSNGDFLAGTERWFFTDDNHLSWRMKDQYLMVLFEQGWLGLIALALLVAWALTQAARACLDGVRGGAIIGACITAFLVSGVFDYLTETPRLASLFYLVCFSALWLNRSAGFIEPSGAESA